MSEVRESSGNWTQCEHVADSTILQAQRLLEETGSVERAKQVVESVAHTDNHRRDRQSSFARRMGFGSYESLLSHSSDIPTIDGKHWHLSSSGHDSVFWNEEEL